MKKIFIFAVPFVLTSSLIFYSYKQSILYPSSDKINHETTINEKNTVTAPTGEIKVKTEDLDQMIAKQSYDNVVYVESLMKDWPTLFDLFTSNTNFKQQAKSINVRDLERVNEKIQMVSKEFKLGNVDNLITEFGDLIKLECDNYKMDWRIVLAIVRQESYFNAYARSHAGAFGLMQLMPRTGAGLQSTLELEETQTPKNNLIAGIYYYATLVSQLL